MVSTFKPEIDLETPYTRAKQVWDSRIGSARQQAANWRLISFGLLGVVGILSVSLAYVGSQSKLVPYVVEVGPRGEFQNKGVATEHNYSPSPTLERYFVSNFVQAIRAISSDPVINRERLVGAYAFLTQRSSEMLKAIHSKNDPMLEAQMKTRSADIETILQVGKNSYQVDWMEVEYDKGGSRTKVQAFRGVFSIVSKAPSNDEEAAKNPLGLYIDHFTWQAR